MHNILQRTTVGMLLLLIIPAVAWLSGWHWQPGGNETLLRGLFWMTETVTAPWGVVTSILLSLWVLWCLRFRLKPAILLLLIMNATVLTGQYTKSWLKGQVRESRPYVLWLEQQFGQDDGEFYQLKRKQRGQRVDELLARDTAIPGWLKQHWAFETGYAFPSGHTLFAASWALLIFGLLWPRRHYKTIVVAGLWAASVMASRLLLGMHWPKDLAMAILLSWLLVTVGIWVAQRLCGSLNVPAEERNDKA